MFGCSRFLQAEVASIWFLEHIIDFSYDYHVPIDLIHLGKTLCHPLINLIHWLPQLLVSDIMQTPLLATELFFHQGIMPKDPENINNKSCFY